MLTFLPTGWILRNIVNFLAFCHLIKGMCLKIRGNWVLLIHLKILTSLLEDYNLDFAYREMFAVNRYLKSMFSNTLKLDIYK